KTSGGDWIVAALLSGCLLALLVPAAYSVPAWQPAPGAIAESAPTSTPIGMGLLGARVDKLAAPENARRGMTGYLLPFEIVSVHLLVVLVGAAYLARTKRRRTEGLVLRT